MNEVEKVYYSLTGQLVEAFAIPWVENAFTSGSPCNELSKEIWDARLRLYDRLGSDDDEDVQIIVDGFYDMQEEMCKKMFMYGMIYGRRTP